MKEVVNTKQHNAWYSIKVQEMCVTILFLFFYILPVQKITLDYIQTFLLGVLKDIMIPPNLTAEVGINCHVMYFCYIT